MNDYPNLGELEGFTKDFAPKMIADCIFHRHPALMGFQDRAKTYPGGLFIREGIQYYDDPNEKSGGSVGRTGEFELVEVEGHDVARYRPRYYVQVIPLWDADLADNGSDEVQYWDFVVQRKALCMKFMQARFARHLYQAAGGGTNINGLGDFFDNTATIGQIDRTKDTNAFWRAYVHEGNGQPRAISTKLIADLVGDISDGEIEPDLILTSVKGWNAVQAATDPRERFSNTTLANLGFKNIAYQGSVPIVYDKYCDIDDDTRHKYYAINFDHLKWRPHKNFNMKRQPWMRMPKNLGAFMLYIWFGNITTNNPRRLGLLKNINPALS